MSFTHTDLEELAHTAALTARLAPAEAVRERAVRRRGRRRLARAGIGVAAVLAVATTVGTWGTDDRTADRAEDPAAASGPSTTPAPGTPVAEPSAPPLLPVGAVPALDGTEQVAFLPVGSGSALAVRSADQVSTVLVTTDLDARSGFVPVPIAPGADRLLIRTAQQAAGGEQLCLAASPGSVVTAACDVRVAAQLWRATPVQATTPAFELRNGLDLALAVEGGEVRGATDGTPLHLVGRGPAAPGPG